MRNGRGASLDNPTVGARDRYLLIVRHPSVNAIVQVAYRRQEDRDREAFDAVTRYGRDAVTTDFVRDFRGRTRTTVWLTDKS